MINEYVYVAKLHCPFLMIDNQAKWKDNMIIIILQNVPFSSMYFNSAQETALVFEYSKYISYQGVRKTLLS